METITLVDPVQNIHDILDGVLRTIIPNEPARNYFGLKGISWKPAGFPGWFLWFGEKPGAYLIEVIDGTADCQAGCGDCLPISRAQLQIKYFPDPSSPADCFDDFSVFEQLARLSDIFDTTGTPSFEGFEKLDPGFFVVGNIDCAATPDRHRIEMGLSAPVRWITCHSEGLSVAGKGGGLVEAVAAGEPDRNVQAWDISWFVFDKLVSCLCYAAEMSPRSLAFFKTPGNVFESTRSGMVVERPGPRVEGYRLDISFETGGPVSGRIKGAAPHVGESPPSKLEGGQDAILIYEFTEEPPQRVPWINSLWWHGPVCKISNYGVECC